MDFANFIAEVGEKARLTVIVVVLFIDKYTVAPAAQQFFGQFTLNRLNIYKYYRYDVYKDK